MAFYYDLNLKQFVLLKTFYELHCVISRQLSTVLSGVLAVISCN